MIIVKRTEADVGALRTTSIPDTTEDGTNWLNKTVKKPWGEETERYRDKNFSATFLCIRRGQQTSLHCHLEKSVMVVVYAGEAILFTLSGEHYMKSGDIAAIEKGAFHQIRGYQGSAMIYELESPPNKNDLIRIHDEYGRGQGYDPEPVWKGLCEGV